MHEQERARHENTNLPVEQVEAINRQGEVVFVGPFRDVIEAIKNDESLGVKAVHVWLVRHAEGGDSGDLTMVFQKRSDNGRLDKFVGGHVSYGMTFDETALKEIEEEMGGLPTVLAAELGSKALSGANLTETAVIVPFSSMPWDISRRYDRGGEVYDKPTRTSTYLGFYDGPLQNIEHDFEVTGIETMTISGALQAIQETPEYFTPDVVKHLPEIAEAFKAFAE